MKIFIRLVRIFIGVLFLGGLLFYFSQERFIFYPSKVAKEFVFQFQNKFEELWIPVGGSLVHALYFEKQEAPGTFIYFHGNAGALDSWGSLADEIVDKTGWNILMVDYPGYGISEGVIKSEAQLHDMAIAVYDEVLKLKPKKVVVFGRSLGSGVAARLATQKKVDAVILETPFYNALEMAKLVFPWLPSFMVRYKLLSNEAVKNITSKILIIHGTHDEIVPYEQGQRLFATANEPREFFSIPEGKHNNLPEAPNYYEVLNRFLNSLN